MKILIVAAIFLISVSAETENINAEDAQAAEEAEEKLNWKELILELNNENFDAALKSHKRLVIFFYTAK